MCNEGNAVRLSEITGYIEMRAPLQLQESYDNSGLILGDPGTLISKVLVCLDPDQTALDSAVRQNCQLVLSHHPAVFNAVKVFTPDRHEGELLVKSIKHDLALYSAHTNFDSACGGLSDMLCKRLGLNNIKVIRQNISTGGECGIAGTDQLTQSAEKVLSKC
jgi:putative NIF3 family GTP cyclohydrolase 1 type 2